MYKIVYLDTETTGLPTEKGALEIQPHMISVSIISEFFNDKTGEFLPIEEYELYNVDSKPFLSEHARKVNGITDEFLDENGIPQAEVHAKILKSMENADVIICHNTKFDIQILWYEALRAKNAELLKKITTTRNFCTSINSRGFKINTFAGDKQMKLVELYKALYGHEFDGQHNALADTQALRDNIHKLLEIGEITVKQLINPPRYSYINIEKNEDGTYHIDISKLCINTVYPILTKVSDVNTSNDVVASIVPFIDDSIILFFANKEQMDLFIRFSNIADFQTTFGFRLSTHLSTENGTGLELIDYHKKIGRKLVNPLTLLKDNGNFY